MDLINIVCMIAQAAANDTAPSATTMLLGAVTVLAGVIGTMFWLLQKEHTETKGRADRCESDRDRLWRTLAKYTGRPVDMLKMEADDQS